ncbi:unnamed protein product [Cuscuta campestris]|uniref:Uncharacterized protein n=1 Tax=Cuscuta campestris TaxID=132261 RepID=A0A484K7S1_9ASTE|nr:unnamed protein product [Cuscuta campestris]
MDEKLRMEAMMVAARKDAKAARLALEKMKEKLVEQAEAYRGLFAKHEGLLKSAKGSDERAKRKIAELAEKAGQTGQLEEENAQLRADLERENGIVGLWNPWVEEEKKICREDDE